MLRSLLLATLSVTLACHHCPRPQPPAPARIVEVEKPCHVDSPIITLKPEDLPDPDAAEQVTLSSEVVVRLGQSIVAWSNYVQLVGARCGSAPSH